jgi:hypothetical protein
MGIFGLKRNHLATLSEPSLAGATFFSAGISVTVPRTFLLQAGSNTTTITKHHCHHFITFITKTQTWPYTPYLHYPRP